MADTNVKGRWVHADRADTLLLVLLVALGTAIWVSVRATTDSPEGDPFESPLYLWTWVVVPLVAFVAGLCRPRWPHPAWWAVALIAAAAIDVAVEGTVLQDPDHGASLWFAGEVVIGVQALCAVLAAKVGQGVTRSRL